MLSFTELNAFFDRRGIEHTTNFGKLVATDIPESIIESIAYKIAAHGYVVTWEHNTLTVWRTDATRY